LFPKATRGDNKDIIQDPSFLGFKRDCDNLVKSSDEAIFNERLDQVKRNHPYDPVAYALNTWINPWKEKFVTYLIDQYLHFGHTTTSIVESLHSIIKEIPRCLIR
jgi:hypothetical protein